LIVAGRLRAESRQTKGAGKAAPEAPIDASLECALLPVVRFHLSALTGNNLTLNMENPAY